MRACFGINPLRNGERGSTLFIVAAWLVVLLGIGALAIDLASLYVARSESQRAADAAALAGAKVFVESGCVTSGDCSSEESIATDRATLVASQNLVGGRPVTVSAVTFTETPQNPQITVHVQSANLQVYFAGAIGITRAPNVAATATAEAYNPSGLPGGQLFCTGCVRPWLIPNCDPDLSRVGPSGNPNCPTSPPSGKGQAKIKTYQAYLLNPGSSRIENPDCYPSGVIGETIQIAVQTKPTQFGAVDDGTGFAGYQKSIVTCNTGQMTCGRWVNTLPKSQIAYPTPAVGTLLHIDSGDAGPGQGQDLIDTTICPPQIHAGAQNPLVTQGVIAENALVTTSDSIVTAYLFDGAGLDQDSSKSVQVHGFVQIFVTQQDAKGDVWGVILGLAGCANADSDGDCDPGSIKGSTLLPIRLITPAGS
jgi:hypothetical protein